ncbi:thioredoxin domain-containing protein, partial [Candidatus Gracilibacteria bacterium]|nr:thioredoxin domain-containing protein [Candidatus Gracilibacteria bacterium]
MSKKKDNTKLLIIIISVLGVFLLVAVGAIAYLLGKSSSGGSSQTKDLEITFISDSRCNNCQEEAIKDQLKNQPVLSNAKITEKDFSDKGVEKYLQENGITALPAIILNHNGVPADMQSYLIRLGSGEYSLNIGASFDPFVERSERGFRQMDLALLESIREGAYIKGNSDAKITWVEYSDLECPFCARLHTSGT